MREGNQIRLIWISPITKHFVAIAFAVTALAGAATAAVAAENVSVKAVMVPKESIKMNFQDGSKHFVLMVRREGKAEGQGALAGAEVTEYGWHDINPPRDGDPRGYLQFRAANGDIANIKWAVCAVFFKGDKKPRLADYGQWELASGTGQFANMTGVGTLTIKPVSKTDRLFTLTGEIGPRPGPR
ncbi:MAG: hypothetical protein ACE5DS_00090 [Kiloniellaceae bacterium]